MNAPLYTQNKLDLESRLDPLPHAVGDQLPTFQNIEKKTTIFDLPFVQRSHSNSYFHVSHPIYT